MLPKDLTCSSHYSKDLSYPVPSVSWTWLKQSASSSNSLFPVKISGNHSLSAKIRAHIDKITSVMSMTPRGCAYATCTLTEPTDDARVT